MKAIINVVLFLFFAQAGYGQSVMGFVNGKLITNTGTSGNDAVTFDQLDTKLATSSPRYKARLQTDANGNLTVTFPDGTFASGIVPIVSYDVEVPSGVTTYTYVAQLMGTPTNTSCTIKVTRALNTPLISVLGALSLFQTPGATYVHIIALGPN